MPFFSLRLALKWDGGVEAEAALVEGEMDLSPAKPVGATATTSSSGNAGNHSSSQCRCNFVSKKEEVDNDGAKATLVHIEVTCERM